MQLLFRIVKSPAIVKSMGEQLFALHERPIQFKNNIDFGFISVGTTLQRRYLFIVKVREKFVILQISKFPFFLHS